MTTEPFYCVILDSVTQFKKVICLNGYNDTSVVTIQEDRSIRLPTRFHNFFETNKRYVYATQEFLFPDDLEKVSFSYQLKTSVQVTSGSTVMSQDNQTFTRTTSELTDVEQPMISQVCQISSRTTNEAIDSDQSTSENRALPESPITTFARQIAALPLSSPSAPSSTLTASEGSSSSIDANSNGTPCKQKCAINLSERFNQKN